MTTRLKILILEDDPERHRAFKRLLFDHDYFIAQTAEEAIYYFEHGGAWDVLFLDHDLGGQTYVPSGNGTGYEVARWLNRNPEKIPASTVLHSLNYAGRQNMLAELPDSFDEPFIWLKEARMQHLMVIFENRAKRAKEAALVPEAEASSDE